METIKLNDGRVVSKSDYIKAKTKDLIEFGYSSLTEEVLSEQLDKILSNAPESELNVIGLFCKSDIKNNEQRQ